MHNIHLALSDLTDLLDFVSCIAKTFTQEHLIIFYFVNIRVGSLSWIIQNLIGFQDMEMLEITHVTSHKMELTLPIW